MKTRQASLSRKALAFLALAIAAVETALAQTQVKPGWNIFSVEQDVEIGRQSAVEAERQLPMLRDAAVARYVSAVGQRLAAVAPGPKFPYQFKVANLSDLNAFALPGGFLYVNRGLIEASRSEAELAGVLAHEIAHTALRHGTANASKAYLAQAGVGILGGLLGGQSGTTRGIIEAVGGLGLNALFLKYSRSAEEQADIVGTQILGRAGYDPNAMAGMFAMLQQQARREPSKLEQFFSSHPAPANREARVRKEAAAVAGARRAPVGNVEQVKVALRRLPPAPTMEQVARGTAPSTGSRPPSGTVATGGIAAPSTRFERYRQRTGFFEIDHPENWEPHADAQGHGVTFVPQGGVAQLSNGQQSLIYGVVVNHYVPFDGQMGNGSAFPGAGQADPHLDEATDDFIREIARGNSHLRLVPNSRKRQRIDDAPAMSVVLAGRSPATGEEERVTIFTRELPDHHVLYALFIAPGRDYTALSRTFQRMISSLRVDDHAAH
ncbi:MAG: M48 family metallopeptidase [Thermoanaerobaculia bacterium]